MAPRKLDIFDLLSATDRRNGNWLSQQSDDAQKEFKPSTAMRWAATINDGAEAAYMLWLVNERVNHNLFELSAKHPDLIFRLLASCGLGKPKKHQWISTVSRKNQANAATNVLQECFPEASDTEISMLLSQFDRSGFQQFIDECGIQPKDAQEVVKAFDKLFPEKARKK